MRVFDLKNHDALHDTMCVPVCVTYLIICCLAQLLPKYGTDMFGIQEALLENGITVLGDVDHLDPGVRGELHGAKVRYPQIAMALFVCTDGPLQNHLFSRMQTSKMRWKT
jgi:hypothetical protein